MKKANLKMVQDYISKLDQQRCFNGQLKIFCIADILWFLTNFKVEIDPMKLDEIISMGGPKNRKYYYLYEMVDYAFHYPFLVCDMKMFSAFQFCLHDGSYFLFVGEHMVDSISLAYLNIPCVSFERAPSMLEFGDILYESNGHNLKPLNPTGKLCKNPKFCQLLRIYYKNVLDKGFYYARTAMANAQRAQGYYHSFLSFSIPSCANLWKEDKVEYKEGCKNESKDEDERLVPLF